jgi:hypothetical protein
MGNSANSLNLRDKGKFYTGAKCEQEFKAWHFLLAIESGYSVRAQYLDLRLKFHILNQP